MGTVSVSLPSDGETIDAADYNTPINTIVNEINGNLDNANIDASAAIDGSKLAAASVGTTELEDSAVTTAKVADGAVTADKLDADAVGHGPLVIGKFTLESPADTITVSSLPNRKYIQIRVSVVATGGTMDVSMRLNGDTGNNYSRRRSVNGGADAGANSSDRMVAIDASSTQTYAIIDLVNVATREKMIYGNAVNQNTAGAGNTANREEFSGKWANTTDAVTSITIYNAGGTGDYAIGSEVIVLGHD